MKSLANERVSGNVEFLTADSAAEKYFDEWVSALLGLYTVTVQCKQGVSKFCGLVLFLINRIESSIVS